MAPVHGPATIHGFALYTSQIIIKIGHIICSYCTNRMYATDFNNKILYVTKEYFIFAE
jgi:hypothetical protein